MLLLVNFSDRCMPEEAEGDVQEYYECPLSPARGDPRQQIADALQEIGLSPADVRAVIPRLAEVQRRIFPSYTSSGGRAFYAIKNTLAEARLLPTNLPSPYLHSIADMLYCVSRH